MNIVRFHIILFSVIFFSCSSELVKVDVVKLDYTSKLEQFFKRAQNDAVKAGNVIEKHKIIQHLTHLRKMDTGGKKYYLLEKDDITEMINSVTEGIYLDYILINKNGVIIYTKKNDELFGANVNSGFDGTPLQKCFLNREGVYFADVSFMAPSSKVYSLYISTPVYVEGSFHGVLILQVETKKISDIMVDGTDIFSRDGIIRVSSFEERILKKYPGFEMIDIAKLDRDGVVLLNYSKEKIKFTKFNYKEINWILMNKE